MMYKSQGRSKLDIWKKYCCQKQIIESKAINRETAERFEIERMDRKSKGKGWAREQE